MMNEYRWVVEKVKVGCEMPAEVSTIHPSLVRVRNGDLLLFGNTYSGNRFVSKSYTVVVCRSADNGETWSKPQETFTKPLAAGKPSAVGTGTSLKSGRIILLGEFGSTECKNKETQGIKDVPTGEISPYGFPVVETRGRWTDVPPCRPLLSDDDGETWQVGDPIDCLSYVAGGSITHLSDGSLLLPVFGYRPGAEDAEQFSNGYVLSKDDGRTWGPPAIVAAWDRRVHDMPNEMGIVELPDGRWVALYRNQFQRNDYNSTGVFLFRSYSRDRGRTWTTGEQIFPNMGYTVATLLPDGALMVIGHCLSGILYAVSSTGGETWDYQNLLWGRDPRDGGDCGGFSLLRLDDGRMLVAYYARADRSKPLPNACEYGKQRLELAWLKKVKPDSVQGRMR